MGIKHFKYKLPLCNSFQATVKDEQICYEVDLDQYKKESDLVKQLQKGLVLYLDYNEDKQLKANGNAAQVYMDTISMIN